MSERFKVRVTKSDDDSVRYELMNRDTKIADLSFVEIIGMIMQFTSSLRWTGVK